VTARIGLAHTAGFLHLGQSRRRAAAVNISGSRTCRPGLTAASTGTPFKAEEPRPQPQDQQPVYTDTLTSSEQDRNAPPVMARRLAAVIPDCTATFCPDDGHLSIIGRHAEAMLSTLG
jgi:hypothetical protein